MPSTHETQPPVSQPEDRTQAGPPAAGGTHPPQKLVLRPPCSAPVPPAGL